VQDAGGAPPLMAAHSRHVLPCDEPAVELLVSEAHCGTSPEPLEPLFLRRLAQELRRKRRRVLVRPPLLRLPQRPLGETLLRERRAEHRGGLRLSSLMLSTALEVARALPLSTALALDLRLELREPLGALTTLSLPRLLLPN
jgi:hypothetical protein